LTQFTKIFEIIGKKNSLLIFLTVIFGFVAVILELFSVFNLYPILLKFSSNPNDIKNYFIKDLVSFYFNNFINIQNLIFLCFHNIISPFRFEPLIAVFRVFRIKYLKQFV